MLKDILEMNELDRQEAQAFTQPSSELYTQFEGPCGRGLKGGMERGGIALRQAARDSARPPPLRGGTHRFRNSPSNLVFTTVHCARCSKCGPLTIYSDRDVVD